MSYAATYADITKLLYTAPRTITELSKLTELSDTPVRKFVKALEGEGLLTRYALPGSGKAGGVAYAYRWSQ